MARPSTVSAALQFFVAVIFTVGQIRAQCTDPPPDLPNADYTKEGDRYKYECKRGFEGSGVDVGTCQGGKWTFVGGEKLKCQGVYCSQPPAKPNADVTYDGLRFNDVATYTCRKGYRRTGGTSTSHQILCQANKKWTTSSMRCEVVVCPNLPNPFPHGDVSRLTSLGSYEYKSMYQVRCKDGYSFNGRLSQDITCLESGEWSVQPVECKMTACLEPVIENGYALGNGLEVNDFRTIRCFDNATIEPIGAETFVMCSNTGEWDPKPPTCKLKEVPTTPRASISASEPTADPGTKHPWATWKTILIAVVVVVIAVLVIIMLIICCCECCQKVKNTLLCRHGNNSHGGKWDEKDGHAGQGLVAGSDKDKPGLVNGIEMRQKSGP